MRWCPIVTIQAAGLLRKGTRDWVGTGDENPVLLTAAGGGKVRRPKA